MGVFSIVCTDIMIIWREFGLPIVGLLILDSPSLDINQSPTISRRQFDSTFLFLLVYDQALLWIYHTYVLANYSIYTSRFNAALLYIISQNI